MQQILIVAHASPYGTEKLFNTLRIALALQDQEDQAIDLKIFLMSDAIFGALKNQTTPDLSYNLQQMFEILSAQQVPILLCKTCAQARGVNAEMIIEGTEIGTLQDLTRWTLAADKVIHI
ncbi:DsrE family protein [Shewanella profunda]|uniref:DsrE/DsrF/TusD sulfur relay family protein n=1 Tax=Shewanella profunda TaxID=254793 RepID=UPI00200BE839|nr:DsrE family protein [Shewanella profunda]MCL1090427.1 DsrE family protein [Shewanella profunda]